MLKKILFVSIVIFIIIFPAFTYENPFWEKKDKIIYKIHKFIPDYIIFNFSNTFDKTRGLPFSFFYEYNFSLNFSDSLFFTSKLCLGENTPKIKTFDVGTYYRPIKFLAFDVDYKFRDFSIYKVAEHDIIIKMLLMFNFIKYFTFSIDSGFALRFVDIDIEDPNSVYKKDWLFNASFKWKLTMLVHPMCFFSAGLSLGNIPEYEIYSFNYWQLEFLNYIHLPNNLTIYFNGGIGYAGSLPMAGIISKGWFRIGVIYAFKTK
jgi:hypothetical protein